MRHHMKNNKYALGAKHSDEVNKEKSSRMRGELHPFYGKHHTEKTRIAISQKLKGRALSGQTKEKMKGRTPWNKGRVNVYSKETLLKMSRAKRRLI